MTVLKPKYQQAVLNDPVLQGKIAQDTRKSINSVQRWAKNSSQMLLLSPSLAAISAHLNVPLHELTQEVKPRKKVKELS